MAAPKWTQYVRGVWVSGFSCTHLVYLWVCFLSHALARSPGTCSQMVLGIVNIQDMLSNFNCGIQDHLLKSCNVTQLSSQREFCQELLLVG